MEKLLGEIVKRYGLDIYSYKAVPRGFCAEAYSLETDRGIFFVKVFTNPRFTLYLEPSLLCQARIAGAVDYVPAPIPTLDGRYLFTAKDGQVVCLYAYVEGRLSMDYDDMELVSLMAGIYDLGIRPAVAETFPIRHEKELGNFWNGRLALSQEVADCVNTRIDVIRSIWGRYGELCRRIESRRENFHLTHGDAPGNVMVGGGDKLYIVDWDDVRLAPIERDFWFFMDTPDKIRSIASTLKKAGVAWSFDQEYYDYYLYTRIFEDLYGYMEWDLTGEKDPSTVCKEITTDIFGWLLPLVK